MLYNPFEQVTKSSFRELVGSGYADFVLQRFEWPDVKEKAGFLLTPYDDKEGADQHAHQLGAKEGRALQLPQDADKIESLLATGSGYRIFLNRIKDENWDKRMLKLYEKNIVNYLRTKTRFQRKNPIDILFSLEYGRVVATISDGQTQKKVFAIDILR
ncbi:hypothetical protein [Sphingobacterium sp.]|uniref:hypothetical protein n=1 Tax=Sphingobacterium sp. TaxID=341027 RepID=UPI00289C61E9|nr:hypothetical protein [Sphingobacterium sp.]